MHKVGKVGLYMHGPANTADNEIYIIYIDLCFWAHNFLIVFFFIKLSQKVLEFVAKIDIKNWYSLTINFLTRKIATEADKQTLV